MRRPASHHLSIAKMNFIASLYIQSISFPKLTTHSVTSNFLETPLSSYHVLLENATMTLCWWLLKVYILLLPGFQALQDLSLILHPYFSRGPLINLHQSSHSPLSNYIFAQAYIFFFLPEALFLLCKLNSAYPSEFSGMKVTHWLISIYMV